MESTKDHRAVLESLEAHGVDAFSPEHDQLTDAIRKLGCAVFIHIVGKEDSGGPYEIKDRNTLGFVHTLTAFSKVLYRRGGVSRRKQPRICLGPTTSKIDRNKKARLQIFWGKFPKWVEEISIMKKYLSTSCDMSHFLWGSPFSAVTT